MTTLSRPGWFLPRQCSLALRKSGLQFVSPFNGNLQAVELLAERWVLSLSMGGAANSDGRSAFFNQWAGGVNLVPLHHFGRPQPLGTLRGTPKLAAATARGNTTISLANCTASNALVGGSFETDANADGIADGWTRYSSGSPGTLSASLSTAMAVHGAKCQSVSASALPSSGGEHGVRQLAVPVSHLAGQAVTAACSAAANGGTRMQLAVVWKTSGGSTISTLLSDVLATGSQQDLVATGTCPATAVTADVFVYQYSGSGGSAQLLVDVARLVAGSSSASYPAAATLLAGDMLGDGAQLYQVASDCTATDAGTMTVPVVNRCRGVVAQDTLVLWDKPTALFALPAMEQGTTWMRGGMVDGLLLDAVEVY